MYTWNIRIYFFTIHYCEKIYIFHSFISVTERVVTIKRRIIKQGHNTLTITLPKSWVEKHQVHAHDELEVTEQNDLLTIQPAKKIALPIITLDVRGLTTPLIWKHLSSAYRAGYDEFKILFEGTQMKKRYSAFSYDTLGFLYSEDATKEVVLSQIEIIQLLINRCIGVEIIDQKENWCTVKEMVETTYKEFDNTLRRIFLLTLSLSDDIFESIRTGQKKEILKSAHIIDTNIDRFVDFCLRVLNKRGYNDYRKTSTIYTTLFILEMVSDEYKKIAVHLIEANKITKKIQDLYRIQQVHFREYYDLFYDFTKEKCLKIYYSQDQLHHHYNRTLFESLNADEKEILHHLKKVAVYLYSLTELRIDLEY